MYFVFGVNGFPGVNGFKDKEGVIIAIKRLAKNNVNMDDVRVIKGRILTVEEFVWDD